MQQECFGSCGGWEEDAEVQITYSYTQETMPQPCICMYTYPGAKFIIILTKIKARFYMLLLLVLFLGAFFFFLIQQRLFQHHSALGISFLLHIRGDVPG